MKSIGGGLVLVIAGVIAGYMGTASTTHVVAESPWGSASYTDVSVVPMVGAVAAICGIVLIVRGFVRRVR